MVSRVQRIPSHVLHHPALCVAVNSSYTYQPLAATALCGVLPHVLHAGKLSTRLSTLVRLQGCTVPSCARHARVRNRSQGGSTLFFVLRGMRDVLCVHAWACTWQSCRIRQHCSTGLSCHVIVVRDYRGCRCSQENGQRKPVKLRQAPGTDQYIATVRVSAYHSAHTS